MTLICDGVQR